MNQVINELKIFSLKEIDILESITNWMIYVQKSDYTELQKMMEFVKISTTLGDNLIVLMETVDSNSELINSDSELNLAFSKITLTADRINDVLLLNITSSMLKSK